MSGVLAVFDLHGGGADLRVHPVHDLGRPVDAMPLYR